jgi:hypothetical protein
MQNRKAAMRGIISASGRRREMTYESEMQKDCAEEADVMAAWVLYLIVVFGLVGYSVVRVFA